MSQAQRLSTQSGFTLLELLVAIMILTMIMTAAMGAVRVASRSLEAGVLRADETARIRGIANVLRRDFRQLLPVTWNENRRDFIAFKGDRHQVQFVAPAPDSSTGPGYLIYRLATTRTDERNSLVLDFAPFDPGSDGFEMPANNGRELLANAVQVSFDYFGVLDDLDSPAWHENWLPDSARLPTVVRMHLASSGQQWPELLFRVRFEGTE
jgi:general secretion pathway protein J